MKPVLAVALALGLITCCTGCSQHAQPTAKVPLTERQRDSILAKSSLPGAQVVGRALDVSDKSADHAAAENAATDSLFR
jgi:hypothetical protein